MFSLKLQLSDVLRTLENTTFVFNTRTNETPGRPAAVQGPPAAPREPGTFPAAIGEGPPALPGSTSSGCQQKKQKLKQGQTGRLRRWRGEEAASGPLPPAGLSSIAQHLQALLLPSHRPCHGHSHPAAPTPLPLSPWQYAPKPSRTLSYSTSFWKSQTEGSARPKLKPAQMWNKR